MKKILVLSDLEGTIGVVSGVSNEEANLLRKKELEVLLEVLLKEKDSLIYLCDCHGSGKNLDNQFTDIGNLQIVQNYWNIDFSIKYEFAIMIGFHAKAGAKGLAHSFLMDFKSVSMGGREVGEIEVFANLLRFHDIKVLFICADDASKAEVRKAKCRHINSSNCQRSAEYQDYFSFKCEIEKAVYLDMGEGMGYNPSPITVEFYHPAVEKRVKEFCKQGEFEKIQFENSVYFLEQLPEISIHITLWKETEIRSMLRALRKKRKEIIVLRSKDKYIDKVLNLKLDQVSYYQICYVFDKVNNL